MQNISWNRITMLWTYAFVSVRIGWNCESRVQMLLFIVAQIFFILLPQTFCQLPLYICSFSSPRSMVSHLQPDYLLRHWGLAALQSIVPWFPAIVSLSCALLACTLGLISGVMFKKLMCQQFHFLLPGNKSDLSDLREVQLEEAQSLAEHYDIICAIETSAKDSSNVEEAFVKVATELMMRHGGPMFSEQNPDNIKLDSKDVVEGWGCGCWCTLSYH